MPKSLRDPMGRADMLSRLPERVFSRRRFLLVVGTCAALCLAVLALTPWIGSTGIRWERVVGGMSPDREIFVIARLPRVLFGALVGGSLAVAGVVFQAVLRNSLATPFTLGVSSGSSLGAVVAIWLGLDLVLLGIPVLPIAAFLGAAFAMALVFMIARTRQALPTLTLLLAGVTLNFIFSALIMFMHYASNFTQSYVIARWMMGSLDVVEYGTLLKMFPFIFISFAVLVWKSARFNPLAVGEEWAQTRGVDVDGLKRTAYVASSVLTGTVTAFSGPIGFVGLIVPHTLRLLAGPDHRILIPASFFAGAAFLVLCDTASRTLFAPAEIPVGVITALLGGPFFVILLRRRKGDLFL